jgi:hypothetical protein
VALSNPYVINLIAKSHLQLPFSSLDFLELSFPFCSQSSRDSSSSFVNLPAISAKWDIAFLEDIPSLSTQKDRFESTSKISVNSFDKI